MSTYCNTCDRIIGIYNYCYHLCSKKHEKNEARKKKNNVEDLKILNYKITVSMNKKSMTTFLNNIENCVYTIEDNKSTFEILLFILFRLSDEYQDYIERAKNLVVDRGTEILKQKQIRSLLEYYSLAQCHHIHQEDANVDIEDYYKSL
jgi:hypothetical protein